MNSTRVISKKSLNAWESCHGGPFGRNHTSFASALSVKWWSFEFGAFLFAELATRATETERTSTAEGRGHLRQLISKAIIQTDLSPFPKRNKI